MSAGDLAERLSGVAVTDAPEANDDASSGAVLDGGKPVGDAAAKARAIDLIDDDRLLQAARTMREADVNVAAGDGSAEDAKLHRFMSKATLMEQLLESLKSVPDEKSGWLVQGEHMGKRDVNIYYRTDPETGTKLTARIESPIDAKMLVPFLSVLNESELYSTWYGLL